jgi:hypothetical protein
MKRFACLAIPLALAACGDNQKNTGDIDAPPAPIDGPTIDTPTPIDAPNIDAPPAVTYTGTFTVFEAKLLGAPSPAPSNTVIAQGIQLGNAVLPATDLVAQHPDSTTGAAVPTGCKIFEYTPAQYLASLGGNEGTATVTVTQTAPAAPAFPTCIFQAGAGYICPDAGSSGTAVGITLTGTGTGATAAAILTLPAGHPATFAAEDIGRFVKFGGTANPTLDASYNAFAIVNIVSPTSVAIGLPLGTGTNIPALTAGTMTTLAGVGPSPAFAGTGQLADDAMVSVAFNTTAAGGAGHVPNFTVSHGDVGNDFTISTAVATRMQSVPTNAALTLECNDAGGSCGTSIGTLVNIVSTDAPVTGLSPFAFPPPVAKRVQIRCAFFDANPVVIPATVMDNLAGATRIQTTYARVVLSPVANEMFTPDVFPLAGHAYVGFTTP